MAIDAGQAGLISMWRSIKATAEWNSDLGLQKAWSQHVNRCHSRVAGQLAARTDTSTNPSR
jgi:hypothetical protein